MSVGEPQGPAGGPPPPKDPEVIEAERICREMRSIAKILPPPSGNELEIIDGQKQYGNNFYMLFHAIDDEKTKPDSWGVQMYIGNADQLYGEKWRNFLKDNEALISMVLEVSRQQRLCGKLSDHFNELIANPKSRTLALRTGTEINLKGLHADVWNRFNPLLKQVCDAMRTVGINPHSLAVT